MKIVQIGVVAVLLAAAVAYAGVAAGPVQPTARRRRQTHGVTVTGTGSVSFGAGPREASRSA